MKKDLIYMYLVEHCIGYDNRVKSTTLMEQFDIKSNKTFRSYIEQIRKDSYTYPKLIGSKSGSDGGYFIVETNKEKKFMSKSFQKRGKRTMKTSSIFTKSPLINQLRMKFKNLF